MEKIERAKKKRDEAKQKAKVALLAAMETGETKVRVEDDLTKMGDGRGLEAEVVCLTVERTSLLLEF